MNILLAVDGSDYTTRSFPYLSAHKDLPSWSSAKSSASGRMREG